jgi:predicted transcriptional regulator of viral defense system
MVTGSKVDNARLLLRRSGVARSGELAAAGLPRSAQARLVARGELLRLARGVYALPGFDSAEHGALLVVAKRAPNAVFCMLTALRLHDLTTQAPPEVWIAIGGKDHAPRIEYPQLRVVRYSPAALAAGVETRVLEGVPIRVTGVAQTVANCFKFRNKIGIDVALEALREVRRAKIASIDEIWRHARIDRVAAVIRPYLEAVA